MNATRTSSIGANTMEERTLGRDGLRVSALGLGCMGMSQSYPPFPERGAHRGVERYVAAGDVVPELLQ